MSVVITEDDFDIAAEHNKLKSASVGAIVTFTGTVRDLGGGDVMPFLGAGNAVALVDFGCELNEWRLV